MTPNAIATSRGFKYGLVLLLVLLMGLAYFFGYQARSGYFLHFTTEANYLAVETVFWNVNGAAETRKEATFSVDSAAREHSIPLASGKYSFTINCYSPNGNKD
ncbi:MAG TPA: hypothetical protein VKR58_05310, partial [Aquella sp.]|nr:hypothetical protein [Aquella sp.]